MNDRYMRRAGKTGRIRRRIYNGIQSTVHEITFICDDCGAVRTAFNTSALVCECKYKRSGAVIGTPEWKAMGNKPRPQNMWKLKRTSTEVLIAHATDKELPQNINQNGDDSQ